MSDTIKLLINETPIEVEKGTSILDAARKAGARGGTVIHARGTGQEKAEQFLGISLAREKDVTLIVTPSEKKAEMIREIMKDAGTGTKAGAIVFALPVTDTAGMVLRPQSEELEEEPPEETEGEKAELPEEAAGETPETSEENT